jgi:hypothetical protein
MDGLNWGPPFNKPSMLLALCPFPPVLNNPDPPGITPFLVFPEFTITQVKSVP